MKECDGENYAVAKANDIDSAKPKAKASERVEYCDNTIDQTDDTRIEVSRCRKRKRIHMDAMDCKELLTSENGSLALSAPLSQPVSHDVNRGLHPVNRIKRKRDYDDTYMESENNKDQNSMLPLSSSQSQATGGFVSASQMYKSAKTVYNSPWKNNNSNSNDGFSQKMSSTKTSKVVKQIHNQGSILNFVSKSSSFSSASSSASNSPISISSESNSVNGATRCVMYSPIKKLLSNDSKSAIYINDSPSRSLSSSQNSERSYKTNSHVSENAVVKKLFAAAKNFDPKIKPKKKKPDYQKKLEVKQVKDEAIKYFENDSFDMNTAFDSDMDDSCTVIKPKASTAEDSLGVSDKYGLLGSGSYPKKEKINYFERLPPEVLENIFCQLPMLDLCLNSNRVCLQWNSIIADEKFVPWKKLYHRLKARVSENIGKKQSMATIMHQNGMALPQNYLSGLIRYMKDFKPVTATNMLECLQKHGKYNWAHDLIKERLQDCMKDEEPNPWSVITTLVILSHDIYEIKEIIQCLTVSSSQCTSKEVIECLYCIACFLFCFQRGPAKDVWNGMHYRLLYALYLYENASSTSCADLQCISGTKTGQQSLVQYSSGKSSVKLTHEQLRIVKHLAGPHEVIKIVAFAGTGKTTTLVRYTQLRPNQKFLLVVYNKSVCDYAKTRFPKNVECRTGHSLAFQTFGRKYAHKLFALKVYTLTQALQLRKGQNLFLQAKFVMTTLESYFASDDDDIDTHHVPDSRFNEKTGLKEFIDLPTKNLYVDDAKQIWRRMKDYNDKKIGMTHDGYLKLYQLSKPKLKGYHCLLIDEAQDLTPAITDILLQQNQGKILVGDPHQQIYSFRGAVNAMERIRADTIFYLTQSFRFGPEIAQVAMSCLEVLKNEKNKTLVGSGKKSTIDGTQVGQLAILSRSNFTVFNEAVKKCCYSNEQCKVAFVGGTTNFGFPMLMDMYALTLSEQEREKENLEISNKLIKSFKSFADLDNFATKSLDNELLGKIKIVKAYNHNLPHHIRKIESKCVKDERQADYVFSTAHKAKGLEFSTVRVTDDFLGDQTGNMLVRLDVPPYDVNHIQPLQGSSNTVSTGAKTDDEENLLYVAVTRAQNALQMSSTLMRVIRRAGETFSYPVYSKDVQREGKPFKCINIGSEFKPYALTLSKKEIKLGEGLKVQGGLISPTSLSETAHSFSGLLGLIEKDEAQEEDKPEVPEKLPDEFYPRGFDG
ncbi:F-box DNA helicase 1 [Mactra antiquata]